MTRAAAALLLLLCAVLSAALCARAGGLWPQPVSETNGLGSLAVDAKNFRFAVTHASNDVLTAALVRYAKLTFPFANARVAVPRAGAAVLSSLSVSLGSADDTLGADMDESYSLTVDATGATLTANYVWGALRGLETFSQLVDYDLASSSYSVAKTPIKIDDAPRFSWRGLLIDTSRHYLSKATILHTLDVMSYSKMNVLHWHLVDAQSFPFVSEAYPQLSKCGSYVPKAVYSQGDVADVVQYAKQLGIRVVIEMDGPGHSYSWGLCLPSITASCPSFAANINNIPLDPTNAETWSVLTAVYGELLDVASDEYFHLGGDEVVTGCWMEDQSIVSWMQQHGMSSAMQLWQYFETKQEAIPLALKRTPVHWEEVVVDNLVVDNSSVIQVWRDRMTLQSVVQKGYRSLLSAGWYLDKQVPEGGTHYEWEDTWINFYQNEPFENLTLTDAQKKLVLGGEACMWGEQVNDHNIDSRVWPRACAAAERLWSSAETTDIDDAKSRLSDHACRLEQRGTNSGPIEPGNYCLMP